MGSVDVTNHLTKEVTISIEQEKYLPELLEQLWAKYGRTGVRQPERKTLILTVENLDEEVEFLRNLVVADPQKTLQSRLVEMAIRATPEGFRVRYHSMDKHVFVFAATEDILKKEWIQEAQDIAKELQEDE
jgi:putative methanogenesis marker protein 17